MGLIVVFLLVFGLVGLLLDRGAGRNMAIGVLVVLLTGAIWFRGP